MNFEKSAPIEARGREEIGLDGIGMQKFKRDHGATQGGPRIKKIHRPKKAEGNSGRREKKKRCRSGARGWVGL